MYASGDCCSHLRARSVPRRAAGADALLLFGYGCRPDHQSLRHPPGACAVHAAAGRRDHHGQRAADYSSVPTRAACSSTTCSNPSSSARCLIDRGKLYAALVALGTAAGAVRLLSLHSHRHGDPRLRRQLARRQGRRPERQAALRLRLRPRLGLRRGRRLHDDPARRPHAAHSVPAIRCSPSSSSSSAASVR